MTREVEVIVYVGEDGGIALNIWRKGYGPNDAPLYASGGYTTVGNAVRAYKVISRRRGWIVTNANIAADQ